MKKKKNKNPFELIQYKKSNDQTTKYIAAFLDAYLPKRQITLATVKTKIHNKWSRKK
jgi:hypothetical protein